MMTRMGYMMVYVHHHGICLGTVPRCTITHKQTGRNIYLYSITYLDKNGLYDGVCPTMEFVSAPCRGVPYTQTDREETFTCAFLYLDKNGLYDGVCPPPWNLSRHRAAVYRTHKQTRGTFTCTLSYLDKNGLYDGVCPTMEFTRGTFTCTLSYLDKNGLYDGVCPTMEFVSAPCRGCNTLPTRMGLYDDAPYREFVSGFPAAMIMPYTQTDERNIYVYSVTT
ncbi:hypothetical protein J6590_089921 [Homalodisca vitripennis]|nr:hypothetical protein J6590_089921 [Homalodisca vitripennis]